MILELDNEDILKIVKDWFIEKYKEEPISMSFDFVQLNSHSFGIGINICTD